MVKPKSGRAQAERMFPCPKGYERHHIDGNPLNNDPSNIQIVKRKEHMSTDGRLSKTLERNKKGQSEDSKQKISAKIKEMWKNGEIRGLTGRKHSEKSKRKMRIKKLGKKATPEAKGKMSIKSKEHIKLRVRDEKGRLIKNVK